MDNYTPQELLNFWKKGKTLSEAAWSFTDYDIWNATQNISLERGNENQKPPENWVDLLGNFAKVNYELNQYRERKQTAKNELWHNLFKKIKRGSLIAIGYKLPMELDDFPKIIPPQFWPPDNTDTDKSSIFAHGFNFVRVQIVRKSALSKIPKFKPIKLPDITVADKKVGRPSLKQEIIVAYEYLQKHGGIKSKFLKSHTEIIQKTVQQLFPEIKTIAGMDHEAIRRAVGDRFKRDKNL